MTPTDLRAAGEALYGPQWQSALAESLGVNRRTIRRWLSGQFQVPDSIGADLRSIAKDRISAIKAAV